MVLHLRIAAPEAWARVKCQGQVQRLPGDDEVYDPFFPEGVEQDEQDAVDFCNGTIDGHQCEVRDECLIFALLNNERFGVWGGMTELARKALRKKWPWRGGKVPRPEWRWMTTEDAVGLVSPEQLAEEDSDSDD